MIGAYVWLANKKENTKAIARVVEIGDICCTLEFKNGSVLQGVLYMDVEPIEATEACLSSVGFRKPPEIDHISPPPGLFNKRGVCVVTSGLKSYCVFPGGGIQFKYLHQLNAILSVYNIPTSDEFGEI